MRRLGRLVASLALGLGLAGAARGASAMSGAEDAKLEKQIQGNLQSDPVLRDDKIDVRVEGSTATLTGTVSSAAERARAAQLTAVGPIRVVDNRLAVESTGVKNAITDSGITAAVKTKFLADETLRRQVISVETNNGIVTLRGTISSEGARRQAVDVARHTNGVRRVDDQLVPAPN